MPNFRIRLGSALMIVIVAVIVLLYLMLPYVREAYPSSTTTTSTEASTAPTTTTPLMNPQTLSIELDIPNEEGVRDFGEIAVIEVDEPDALRFKLINWSAEGLRALSLNGRVDLVSEGTSYKVDMPCMLYFNASCARIMLLIPGYDGPLRIEPGRYSVRLEMRWSNAEGSGKVKLHISTRAYKASIIDLGYRIPEDTASWVMAEGSTRSYALLINRVEAAAEDSGYGEFTAYLWVFAPVEEEAVKVFKFEIKSLETGKVEHHLEIPVEKRNATYRVMLLIKAAPGEYRLSILQPINLSVDLRVK
ncbi:MAG: hypothetical protein QXU12_02565 [Nitrososphaerota archaeon]